MLVNPLYWSFRQQFFAGVVVCIGLLGYALFEQHLMGTEPCPLCILQRIAFVLMGLFFLLGAVHGPGRVGRRVYALLVGAAGAVGMAIAGRHLWLQSLPADEVPDCGPGLSYMLDAFPLSKTLDMVLTGSGECAEMNWSFLGLSMPAWTLVCYVLLTAGALWAGFMRRASRVSR